MYVIAISRFMLGIAILLVAACAQHSGPSYSTVDIPPFYSEQQYYKAASVLAKSTADTSELLYLPTSITAYFDPHLLSVKRTEQKARLLHSMLLSPAFLDIDYDRSRSLTAAQVFDLRQANCISYANLYIALARHYGLNASYQMLASFPEWNREGDIILMDIHINSHIQLSSNREMHVDISRVYQWRPLGQYGKPEVISDHQATALFYNNLAMDKYAANDLRTSWGHLVTAIALAPELDILWSNLGMIYRVNQQIKEAESSYLIASQINPKSYSALTNLAALYQQVGNDDNYQHYIARLEALKAKNPYFYVHLARVAEQENKVTKAIAYMKQAIRLKEDEPGFTRYIEQLYNKLERKVG